MSWSGHFRLSWEVEQAVPWVSRRIERGSEFVRIKFALIKWLSQAQGAGSLANKGSSPIARKQWWVLDHSHGASTCKRPPGKALVVLRGSIEAVSPPLMAARHGLQRLRVPSTTGSWRNKVFPGPESLSRHVDASSVLLPGGRVGGESTRV